MARLGHHVVMFANCERPGMYDGVLYKRIGEFANYVMHAPHDVAIVQRMPEAFAAKMNNRLNVLWCHDLAVGRRADVFRSTMWNVDKIAVLSDFMAEQYREAYQVDASALWRTRNGIDVDVITAAAAPARDRNRLIFGARPERGLDVLVDRIFPTLLMKRDNLTLALATYGNEVAHLRSFHEQIARRVAEFGPRVAMLPPLSKPAYYEQLAQSGVYVYPTPSPTAPMFREISCITAMECQAAGLPIVTSRIGALPETIAPGAGTLIDGDASSDEYLVDFCDAVLRYVRDDAAWAAASEAGRRHGATLGWGPVAEQWTEDLTRFIVERNDSPSRLVRQFIRRSDIVAANALLASMPPGDEVDELAATIQTGWQFAESDEGLREQYEKVGQTHTDVFATVPQESRFQLIEAWLRARPEIARVLDYGCAHGAYTVNLANRVGREWVGVDIDKHSISWAEFNRKQRATTPDAIQFRIGTHTVDLSDVDPFDALIAFEVLEHVPDPTVVIDRLEAWVKPDGHVILTVPFGPWEWMSYRSYPHRCHLWEFDLHDIRDLFGKKKDLRISVMPAGKCQPLGESLGWHIIEYRVDGTPTGTIDMARKLQLQSPRQTVSTLMIAGPGSELTLGWALESVRDLADEIIIGDTGLSDEGRRICADHGARVIQASDPLAQGFEAPRNDALAHARMDWVLWFDTDEKVTGAHEAGKYLRPNTFSGYSIRQHNFSCDAPHEDTLPTRLFRRAQRADGKTLRWWGMIHEQPEYAINEGAGRTIVLRDVHIAHLGYLTGEEQFARFHRNAPLLQRDIDTYPERKLQKFFICRDHITLAKWGLAQSGGTVTPDIEAQCRRVIELYREHFLGQVNYLNLDALAHYSSALEILGEGIEVVWSLASGKTGTQEGAPTKARFATMDEAETELKWRLRALMQPYASPWW
jgi:glycosyltransferase involved in cell wall biosynthesis/SAM-dependent methyltransferase